MDWAVGRCPDARPARRHDREPLDVRSAITVSRWIYEALNQSMDWSRRVSTARAVPREGRSLLWGGARGRVASRKHARSSGAPKARAFALRPESARVRVAPLGRAAKSDVRSCHRPAEAKARPRTGPLAPPRVTRTNPRRPLAPRVTNLPATRNGGEGPAQDRASRAAIIDKLDGAHAGHVTNHDPSSRTGPLAPRVTNLPATRN